MVTLLFGEFLQVYPMDTSITDFSRIASPKMKVCEFFIAFYPSYFAAFSYYQERFPSFMKFTVF